MAQILLVDIIQGLQPDNFKARYAGYRCKLRFSKPWDDITPDGTTVRRDPHEMYRNGEIDFMNEDEYVSTVCDFLEYLPPKTTIHRLAGNGLRTELVAPRWIGKKLDTLNRIDREFLRRNTQQGFRFEKTVKDC